jgi:hypothetical protein
MLQSANVQLNDRRQFVVVAALIVFLALAVRVVYVVGAKVDEPIRGDVNQYVLYAWNLTHHATFSKAMPEADVAQPDSYRGPGYPAMLALTMVLAGHSDLPVRPGPQGRWFLGYASDTWMRYALAAQVVLSTLTVLLTILLARLWLARGAALAVGLLVAIWPHLISFSGVLLSETLFAFTIALSLWLLCTAERRSNTAMMAAAGMSFGFAYLVNPIILVFPLLVGATLWIVSRRRLGTALLLAFLVAPCAWGVRDAGVQGSTSAIDRAAENFVDGSWPQYHAAYNSRFENEISAQIMAALGEELNTFLRDRSQGLAMMRERMALDPGYYAGWYLLTKPFLLWDWAIRIGSGDIYFVETVNSPLERYPVLQAIKNALRAANPVLFALALGAVLLVLVNVAFRRRNEDPLPVIPAALFAYVTALHVVLQAEPRYSIPFRPTEILLACWLVALVAARVAHFRQRRAQESPLLVLKNS